jgi:hypothetical protein
MVLPKRQYGDWATDDTGRIGWSDRLLHPFARVLPRLSPLVKLWLCPTLETEGIVDLDLDLNLDVDVLIIDTFSRAS